MKPPRVRFSSSKMLKYHAVSSVMDRYTNRIVFYVLLFPTFRVKLGPCPEGVQ